MQISYTAPLGFSIKGNDASVALALESKQIDGEDVIVTRDAEAIVKATKAQTVMDWAGEYESKGVAVMIIPVGAEKTGRVVKLMIDDIAMCHLTDVSEPLGEAEEERIGNIDILFVPVGAGSKLEAVKIRQLIESIDPRLVIPMGFAAGEQLEFAKALGFGAIEEVETLKLKKSDLASDRMDLKVLKTK